MAITYYAIAYLVPWNPSYFDTDPIDILSQSLRWYESNSEEKKKKMEEINIKMKKKEVKKKKKTTTTQTENSSILCRVLHITDTLQSDMLLWFFHWNSALSVAEHCKLRSHNWTMCIHAIWSFASSYRSIVCFSGDTQFSWTQIHAPCKPTSSFGGLLMDSQFTNNLKLQFCIWTQN